VFAALAERNQLISQNSKGYRYTIPQRISEQFKRFRWLFSGGAKVG